MINLEQEDTILIQNILKGNLQAQEILFKKYKKSIRKFLKAKYLTINNNDIDDYISEILIKVFLNLNLYDKDKSKFSSWVFEIAKNHMIDNWRNKTPTYSISQNNISYNLSTSNNSDSTNLMSYITSTNTTILDENIFMCSTNSEYDFENCNSINFISQQLSAQDFTLLDMKYVQGYNYSEIGSEFNVSSSTISNRVNYIKTKLKQNNKEIIFK